MSMDTDAVVRRIAGERMSILYGLAERTALESPELSRSYVLTLRRIGSHYKVKIPAQIENSLCKGCGSVLIPGKTAKVRLVSSSGYVARVCSSCGAERRMFYKN